MLKILAMYVSGFSFVRNAIKYDYPVAESIKSVLPICDEFILAVGNSDDATLECIKNIKSSKIKIIQTIWNDSLRNGGKALAIETNKAFANISSEADWAFYIQADEVLHEKYLDNVYNEMKMNLENRKIDGLLFGFVHFYGSYNYIASSPRWYRNEIRIIKNDRSIYSYRDAQGFRKGINKKLSVKKINAEIYHYGWVRHPSKQLSKLMNCSKLWHNDRFIEQNFAIMSEFDYNNGIELLAKFTTTHPKVMNEKIKSISWQFDFDITSRNLSIIDKFRRHFESITGYRLGEYKNYILHR